MSLSLHEASIGQMVPMLKNLSKLLDKAGEHIAAKGAAARLAGVEIPSFPDIETNLPELQDRIAKTIAFLESVDAAAVSAADDKPVQLKFPNATLDFTGKSYVTTFVLPNFYFHVSIAYALLRAYGVSIGKRDYLGG